MTHLEDSSRELYLMPTKLSEEVIFTNKGRKADKIIKSCVHCGFCLATCPTYQLTGNELDSPRGRIYLIRSALEGNQFDSASIQHLDKCLTCRACESTCPSGVKYGELADIGREFVEKKRALWQKIFRHVVRLTLTTPKLFNIFGRMFRHSTVQSSVIKASEIKSRVLLLAGCVQPSLAPNINHVTKNVLAKLGIKTIETKQSECCGALDQHLSAQETALNKIRINIDNWHKLLEGGLDAIISNASGCGLMVKDYPSLFETEDPYYKKSLIVSQSTKDIAEYLSEKDLTKLRPEQIDISYHAPCTLQHGQKLPGLVEALLAKLGYQIAPVIEEHLCCGSAGSYSIFQQKISKKLRDNKIRNLSVSKPDVIVTANIGCLMHLSKGTKTPVKHWIELLDN
ncbi:MAG: glycolate oxidase iron-sulfur subunit [Polaribacter sp.]